MLMISTYNGNCMRTAAKWLQEATASINVIQETKLKGAKYKRAVKRAKAEGRTMVGTQSITGRKGGLSSGTALFVDKTLDITSPYSNKEIPQGQEHLAYEVVPGRASAIVVHGWGEN